MSWPEQYLGIPWNTGGRTLAAGLDCWGLLRVVYERQFNILLPEYAAPEGSLASPQLIEEAEGGQHLWTQVATPQPGDAVALGKGLTLCHVGVYVQIPDPALLHSTLGSFSAITTLKVLRRQGYTNILFYRHAERDLN